MGKEELINRQDAIDAMVKYVADGYAESPNDFEGYMGIVKELPSAQPDIIRCKDCKYMTEHYDTDWNVPYWTCSEWDSGTDYDGFCYHAERRTDETD